MAREPNTTHKRPRRHPSGMQKVLTVAVFLVLLVGAAAAADGSRYINASGPAFLQPFGPHDGERVDNPVAAAVTAVVVAGVIYNGLRRWKRNHPDDA